ncbi:hypothetical protein BKI52_22395 [marine bacterium AO1-C]|nr:hypothetical protein BKI52_22395 [marine bacterium AO1-C]
MSDISPFLAKTAESLQKQLSSELEVTEVASPPATSNYEDLVQWLTPYIQRLLNDHFEKLLQLLYRVDVSENHFKEAIGQPNSDAIASSIARLIVDRQIQKVQIRAKYSQF